MLHRFAVLTAAATLVLLGAGGLVTSHGVGLAVPDWPNTYGYNMFAFPVSQWIGGIFYEHSHRLIASAVGLLTAILAAWLWMRETDGRKRWLGIGGIVLVLVLMGVRKMPVYVTLAALAVVVMAAGFWRFKRNPGALRWLGMAALAMVIFQGVLGGLRVVWLKDEIGIFHATLAQLFFVLMCALALFTSKWWQGRVTGNHNLNDGSPHSPTHPLTHSPVCPLTRKLALATTLLILLQLILGATMRHQHAGLAIPDFPLAYGKLWPAMDAESVARYNQQRIVVIAAHPITAFQIGLQMAHRLMAGLIVIGVSVVAWRMRRRSAENQWHAKDPDRSAPDWNPALLLRRVALVWLGLILGQAALGAWTIWSNKAADVATAHVLGGALSLVTGALWWIISFPRPVKQTDARASRADARASDPGVFGTQPALTAGK